MKVRVTPLGIELKKQRQKQQLTIRQLAGMINRNRCYLSQIELGRKIPGPRILEDIAAALEIDRNLLLRHINLLKMDFTAPVIRDRWRSVLDELSPQEMERVVQYIEDLKYSGDIPGSKSGIK